MFPKKNVNVIEKMYRKSNKNYYRGSYRLTHPSLSRHFVNLSSFY